MPTSLAAAAEMNENEPLREIRHEYSLRLPALLEQLSVSLLVSTYQAGKLVVVGSQQGRLVLAFPNFERVMGVAVSPDRLAVGTRSAVWFLRSAPELAPRLDPPGSRDACYLTRTATFTGDIQSHELAWSGRELWVVNTVFSCLCTLHDDYNFIPRWRPPFITALAAEDRCHLNGVAFDQGQPRYVTALAAR